MRNPRTLIAGVLATVAKILVVVLVITVYVSYLNTKMRGTMSESDLAAAAERIANPLGMIVGFLAALVAAWWTSRRAGAHAVRDAIYIGLIMSALELVFDAFAGGIERSSLLSIAANVAGALAGVGIARLRQPRVAADR